MTLFLGATAVLAGTAESAY